MSAAPAARPDRPVGPPSLVTTASVVTWGHLTWVPWFWFGGAVVFGGIVVAMGTWGEVTSSVWQGIVGWLAWVVFAAGVTTVTSYARTFVANGITRDRLSSSTVVSVAVLAVLGGVVAALGYAVEDLIYGWYGWPQELGDGDVVDGIGSIAGLGLAYLAVLPVYFASGWLVGVAWNRLGWVLFLLSLVPAVAPLLVAGAVGLPSPAIEIEQLDDVATSSLAVTLPALLAVAAGAMVLARRLSRDLVVDP